MILFGSWCVIKLKIDAVIDELPVRRLDEYWFITTHSKTIARGNSITIKPKHSLQYMLYHSSCGFLRHLCRTKWTWHEQYYLRMMCLNLMNKKNDFLSFYNWLVSDSKFFPSLSTIAAYILRIFLLHSLLYYHSQTALSSSYLRIPCTRTWVSGDDNSSCYSKMRYWLPSTSWYLTQLLMALHIIIY